MGNACGGLFEHAGVALDEEYVEEEIEGQWSEVDECCQETPILLIVSMLCVRDSSPPCSYLTLVKHGAIAVEQLEGREDVTLYQDARQNCCCGPPSCANGHLKEPLFEWELSQRTVAASQHCSHVGCLVAGFGERR